MIGIQIKIILLSLLVIFFTVDQAIAEMISIKGKNINMRSGPGKKYKVLWQLGDGFPLKVLKRKGNWIRVSDFESSIGWIHKSVTHKRNHMIVKVHKKSKKLINVRKGPGTKNKIVAKAYYGVVFKTIKQQKGWAKIKHEKGVTGWVKRSLLWGW